MACEAEGKKYTGPSSAGFSSPKASLTSATFSPASSASRGSPAVSENKSSAANSRGDLNAYLNSEERKADVESYFSKRQDVNASRPDDLPPSQGGKYGGFGNSAYQSSPSSAQNSDIFGMLSSGWSTISTYLEEGAKVAIAGAQKLNETVIVPAANAVKDGTVKDKVINFFQSEEETSAQSRNRTPGSSTGSPLPTSESFSRPTATLNRSPSNSVRSTNTTQVKKDEDQWDSWN